MSRCWLILAFLVTGFSFTVLQTVAIRELLVSFSGNELSVGLILGAWLLLQAMGSSLAGRLAGRLPRGEASYAALQASFALLLGPTFLLVLRVRALLGTVPGEVAALLPAFLATLLVLAPAGLVGGAAFVAGCRVLPGGAGRVYAYEAAGSIAGGVAFTYLLLPLLTSTQMVLLLVAVNALAAAAVLAVRCVLSRQCARQEPRQGRPPGGANSLKRPRLFVPFLLAGLGIGALAVAFSPLGPALHAGLVAGRWAPYPVAFEGNSPYGNVAVLAQEGQVTVFTSGALALTAPDPDTFTVEQLVHLPALFLDEPPRSALVIGGGAGGVLAELERYPLERLDYAEPDPLLIRAVQAVPTSLTTAELADPRLHIAVEDGRRFVQHAGGPYDLVLIHLPPPTTLVLNRLYTVEFLAQVRTLLAPRGVLLLPGPPARGYLSPTAAGLLSLYDRTLRAVFPYVRAIPADEQTLWLVSPANPLDPDAAELVRRWEERGGGGRVLRGDYLRYLLDETVAAALEREIAVDPAPAANSDASPIGLRYALAYESARLSPALVPFFQLLGLLRGWHLGVGIAVLAGAGLLFIRRQAAAATVAVATTGLAGMTANVLVLLSFQVLYGSVYQQVGLLTTAFMAGLGLGAVGMTAWAGRRTRPWRFLLLLEGMNVLVPAGLAGLLFLLLRGAGSSSVLAHALLLAANATAGLLVGLEFPLANHLLVGGTEEGTRVAGALYAADLVGATIGAALVAAVCLPVLGLVGTALLMALVKVGSALVVLRAT